MLSISTTHFAVDTMMRIIMGAKSIMFRCQEFWKVTMFHAFYSVNADDRQQHRQQQQQQTNKQQQHQCWKIKISD